MSRPSVLADRAPVFAALGDETRLRIVERLGREKSLSITALSEGAPVTRQAISKHLRVLQTGGLVESHKRGREQLWELRPTRLNEAMEWLDGLSRQWDVALEKLRAYVES